MARAGTAPCTFKLRGPGVTDQYGNPVPQHRCPFPRPRGLAWRGHLKLTALTDTAWARPPCRPPPAPTPPELHRASPHYRLVNPRRLPHSRTRFESPATPDPAPLRLRLPQSAPGPLPPPRSATTIPPGQADRPELPGQRARVYFAPAVGPNALFANAHSVSSPIRPRRQRPASRPRSVREPPHSRCPCEGRSASSSQTGIAPMGPRLGPSSMRNLGPALHRPDPAERLRSGVLWLIALFVIVAAVHVALRAANPGCASD